MSQFTLADLERKIAERAQASASESYTRALIDKGVAHCAKKLGEEAVEVVLAAVARDRDGLAAESADLIYHWLVLMSSVNVGLDAVAAKLEAREGTSGIAEKAGRKES